MGEIKRREHPAPSADLPPMPPKNTDLIAPDARGMNFFAADRGLQDLLALYMPADLHRHMLPHLERLGQIAGGRLDELAELDDKHPPVLHHRDRFGREAIGYGAVVFDKARSVPDAFRELAEKNL